MTTENPETKRMEDNLVAYIKEKDARIAKLEEDLKEATKRREQSAKVYEKLHPEPVKETKMEQKKEEAPPHFVGKWQKFCPACGDPNPEFKDETVCSTPGCGMHLGAIEDLPKLKACPNCGGKEAKKLEAKD